MLENKKIAVIRGGESAEKEVSIKTGKVILEALEQKGYQTLDVDPVEDNLYELLEKDEIGVAYIALHGKSGEAGTLQGLFELAEVPYTGSGVLASALAMDKGLSKKIFTQEEITTPKFLTYYGDQYNKTPEKIKKEIAKELGFPVVVKPAVNGSSIGLKVVKEKAGLDAAIEKTLAYGSEMLIERYIEGREISVGLLGNKNPQTLPVIEIKSGKEFYDYEAKYTEGVAKHLIPAPLGEDIYNEAQKLAVKAHRSLKCEGVSRVDMIVKEGQLYVLEVNTVPGMTKTSLLPEAAEAAGIEFPDLIEKIVEFAVESQSK